MALFQLAEGIPHPQSRYPDEVQRVARYGLFNEPLHFGELGSVGDVQHLQLVLREVMALPMCGSGEG